MYSPILFQPNSAVFKLEVGGLSRIYRYEPGGASIPMHMTIKETAAMGHGTVSFTLFDDTGMDVEPYLWMGRDKSKGGAVVGTIQWGYMDQGTEVMSEVRNFILQGYNIAVGKDSFTIVCTGILTIATIANNSNQFAGTAKECFERVAKAHNYKLDINPPIAEHRMRDMDYTGSTTELSSAQFVKNNEETDLAFIQRLVTNCVSADGKTGYVLSFVTESGTDVMRVSLPENAPMYDKYIVQDKDSVVLEWNPNISMSGILALNADQVTVNGYQSVTGDDYKRNLDPTLTHKFASKLGNEDVVSDIRPYPTRSDPTEIQQYCSEIMEDGTVSGGVRVRGAATGNGFLNHVKYMSDHIAQSMYNTRATLKILGDPYAVPNRLVDIVFKYPQSYRTGDSAGLHYSSGKYFVHEVFHEIVSGQYHTTMTLGRRGIKETPDKMI